MQKPRPDTDASWSCYRLSNQLGKLLRIYENMSRNINDEVSSSGRVNMAVAS